MKYDLILAGVGGQGVLSVASVIAGGALKGGLFIRQSEVHGMAQRGGAVQAHLRLSDREIAGDLIGKGSADMILSMEPLESLRYLAYLRTEGFLVTSKNPVRNIPDYPDLDGLYEKIKSIAGHRLIDAQALAKQAGTVRSSNMVMVGAASGKLPVSRANLLKAIEELFASRGDGVVQTNLEAFRLGLEAWGQ